MGRGLSTEQKRILGIAYHANRLTMGEPTLKAGDAVNGYKVPTVNFEGPKDMQWPLAAHLIHNLEWTPAGFQVTKGNGVTSKGSEYFDLMTSRARSAKASTIRSIGALCRRNLLILAPKGGQLRWGYVLTKEGMEIGKDNDEPFEPSLYVRAGLIFSCRWRGVAAYHDAVRGMDLSEVIKAPYAGRVSGFADVWARPGG